jgi:hypothetical protein
MFERSEFGRRAAAAEKRRAPVERSSSGGCQERMVLATFAKTKVARAQRDRSGLIAPRNPATANPQEAIKKLPLRLGVRRGSFRYG